MNYHTKQLEGVGSNTLLCRIVTRTHTMDELKITDLTLSELKAIIKETVQEALAEVLIEINTIAEAEADIMAEAEITEFLKTSLQRLPIKNLGHPPHLDD